MTFQFVPAQQFTERASLFVALVSGTNSSKTFSALRLRGIAGKGKIARAGHRGRAHAAPEERTSPSMPM